MDKKIKLLVLLVNQNRKENMDYEIKYRYSKLFNNIVATYTLTFWNKKTRKNKKTGKREIYSYPIKKVFTKQRELVSYLLEVKNNNYEVV